MGKLIHIWNLMYSIVAAWICHRSHLDHGPLVVKVLVCKGVGEHKLIGPLDIVEELFMSSFRISQLCNDSAGFPVLLSRCLEGIDMDSVVGGADFLKLVADFCS